MSTPLVGRSPGRPNKARAVILTMLQSQAKRLAGEEDYDPLRSILQIITDPTHPMTNRERVWGHAIISEYTHGKRKAIEVTDMTASQALNQLVPHRRRGR